PGELHEGHAGCSVRAGSGGSGRGACLEQSNVANGRRRFDLLQRDTLQQVYVLAAGAQRHVACNTIKELPQRAAPGARVIHNLMECQLSVALGVEIREGLRRRAWSL